MSKSVKTPLLYIGPTFSWDYRTDWKIYVDLAKRFGCRWEGEKKLWRVPTFATSVELTRAVLALVPASSIEVRDFETGRVVLASAYISHDYLKRRAGTAAVKRLPFQLLIEGTEAYLSLPLDEYGRPLPEHALYYGLATVGCAAVWTAGKGFHLRINVHDAVSFLVKNRECPVVGVPKIFEPPFVCELYDKIMEHQVEGVSYLYHRSRSILADDMGLGKTMQAILASEQVKMDGKGKAILIICPVTLISNWHNELRMWGCEYGDKNIHIVPYSRLGQLTKLTERYHGGKGLVVIADEAHYLKNPAAQRTKNMMQFVAEMPEIERLWFLTGTPVTKDFSNLWPLAFMIKHPLADKYRPSEMDNVGAVKVQEIRGAISTHMLCRKKTDILTLPPKMQSVKQVDTGEDFDKLFDWEFMASDCDDEEFFKHLMRLKRMTAQVKVEHTVDTAKQILAEGRKVVVFSDHTAVLDTLAAAFPKAVRLCGQTPQKLRGVVVDRFQTDPNCRVFLGHIKAAGVGITLTAASDVIFNDFDWLPANMQQAEDRCYRIGQKGTVNIYYMADCNLVLDDILCQKLADRSAMIATFEMSKQSVMTAMKDWIKQKVATMRKRA